MRQFDNGTRVVYLARAGRRSFPDYKYSDRAGKVTDAYLFPDERLIDLDDGGQVLALCSDLVRESN